MVNSRQLAAPIDESLKNHIADAIAAAMANVTKSIADQVNKSIDAMNESIKGVCTRKDFLCAEMKKLSGEASTSTVPNRANHPKVSIMAKIEFPKFSGDDPTGWVYRCNHFFKVDAVEENQKVKLAFMHLYDKALAWHQQYSKMYGEDMLWEVYVEALLKRFCSTYEDHMTDLKNISQKVGSVHVYIDAFDVLMTKVEVHESQVVSFFLGGLDKDIEMGVRMFKPQILADAYCLSKLQETNNNVSKKQAKALLLTPRYNQSYNTTFTKPNSPQMPSDSAVQNREGSSGECQEEINVVAQPHISLNAISGVDTFQTMRVKGQINNRPVNILIDCGSTHNFLDITTAKQIGCSIKESYPLQVTVPGGNFLTSSHVCKGLVWKLQGETFQSNMMLIPLVKNGVHLPMKEDSYKRSSTTCTTMDAGQTVTTKPTEVYSILRPLLQKYEKVFAVPTTLPLNRKHDHRIPLLDNSTPVNIRPCMHPPTQKDVIKAMVTQLLESGVIRESHIPFSSPIVMVKKKDGTWRMCVDYRALNKKSVKDKFHIPIIEELIDELFGAQVFTKLDLRSGYHQIRMSEDDVHKTVFRTHQGHYEFLVMPFGLTNAPSSFQALMNEMFAPFLRKFVLVFFEDIFVYSRDMEEHAKHLERVLHTMQSQQLYAKMSKCVFGTTQVEYLGHVISGEGVSTDVSKVKAMQDWPVPVNIKKLRGFLGLTGYYRRFIKNYASISKPLTALLKKNAFKWSQQAQEAFEDLKKAMMNAHVLALPNFKEEFIVETYASDEGIGAVLQQRGHPIAFLSRSLAPRHKGLSTYEKELWVVVYALENWRGYDYEIIYKKGSQNIMADALSRTPLPSLQTMVIASISNDLLQRIQASWETGPSIQQIIKELETNGSSGSKFSWKNGQLRRNGRLVIGCDAMLWTELLKYYHNEPLGGHSGVEATYKRMKAMFYWKGMKRSVKEYVRICHTFWTDVTMDFIEGLPSSQGKTVILVVVDRLSKYAHFIPLVHPFKAAQIARVFLDTVYKLHGLPQTITSDRDKVFISHFWKELFKKLGVTLQLSTSYHPKTDGQSEIVNKCLECYLRCMTSEQPKKWVNWLALTEFWYNTNYHTAINTTPFEVVYGQKPPTHVTYMADDSHVESMDRTLVAREADIGLLQFHLERDQQRMKIFADRNRSDRSFVVGDWVLLKLQPHKQVTLRMHKQHKFSPKFYGPFQCNKEGLSTAVPVAVLDRKIAKVKNAVVVYWLVQWSNGNVDDATWEEANDLQTRYPGFGMDS
ncbi:retrotransposon-related protein [Tanacetum coccineum]